MMTSAPSAYSCRLSSLMTAIDSLVCPLRALASCDASSRVFGRPSSPPASITLTVDRGAGWISRIGGSGEGGGAASCGVTWVTVCDGRGSGFSPPEQYSGAGTTPVSDVYSLGATLYAVLTGQKPPDSVSLMVGGSEFQPPHIVNPNRKSSIHCC